MPWFPCQFSWDLYNCFWTFTPAFARRDLHPLSLSALCPLSPCLPSAMHVIPLRLLCMLDCLQLTFSPRLQSVWLWTEFCLNKKKKNQTFLHPPPYKSKNYRKHKTKPQAFHLFSNASRDVTGNILKIQAEGSFKTSGYCFQSQGSCSKSSEEWTTKANPFRFLCPWWEQQQREGGSASSLRVQMWLQDVVLHLSLEVWIKSCQADFKSRSQSRKWHSFHLQCLLVDFTWSLIFIPAKPLFVPWEPRALCAQTPDECGGDGELLRTRVTQPAELQRWPITHPSRVGSQGPAFYTPYWKFQPWL